MPIVHPTGRAAQLMLAASLTLAACGGDATTPTGPGNQPEPPPAAPQVLSATGSLNPHNVLSAVIVARTRNADSARVLYLADGQPADSTPFVRLAGDSATLITLGLRPSTGYRNVVQVAGPGGVATSDTVAVATGALPDPLRHVAITTTGTGSPGLTLTALPLPGGLYAFAFDSAGVIRWYRGFDDPRTGGEVKQQANGNFTIYIGASFGSQPVPGYYVEFSPAGDSLRTFAAPAALFTDNHELWITTAADGTERIHLFGYDLRPLDLTSRGGQPGTNVAGHSLLRLTPDGAVEFSWSAWDHLSVDDWIEPPALGPSPTDPDFDHPNAIDFDHDGNYIVSWRNLGEVSKIDARTGAFLWRLGGRNNQFTFVNDPLNGFSAQHSSRVLPNGNLLIFDNGTRHHPAETRAVEYAIDTVAKTATLVWEFRHIPAIYTPYVGSVQRLGNGNTLIGFALVGHATEATAAGTAAWEADVTLDGKPGPAYRFIRLGSLYR